VEDEKAEESSNPDSNPDILRVQAEVEKTTSEAEAAGTTHNLLLPALLFVFTAIVRDIFRRLPQILYVTALYFCLLTSYY
jgi:hypothetical protein